MNQNRAAAFVEENLKTIFAYALSRVSHKEDAEDLAGEIVLAILQSTEQIRNPDAFYGYVWRIAANTYKKFMKKKLGFLLTNWTRLCLMTPILSRSFVLARM